MIISRPRVLTQFPIVSFVKRYNEYSTFDILCSLYPPSLIRPNHYIRLSEKFLSFHKLIIDEQQLLFYIILLNLVWSISFHFYYYVRAQFNKLI